MAIDFPAGPALNDEFDSGFGIFVWNGQGWMVKGVVVDAYTKAESDAIEAAQDAKNLTDFVNVPGDTMTGSLTISADVPSLGLNKTNPATTCLISGQKLGLTQWTLSFSAGATGDLTFARHDDAGVHVDYPFSIERTSGVMFTTTQFGFGAGNNYISAIQNSGTNWNFYSDTTRNFGMFMANGGAAWLSFSDARLPWKVSAAPVDSVLDRLGGVQLYSNELPSTGKVEMFVKAQELATTLPELVDEPTGPQARDANYVPQQLGDPNAWSVMYGRAGVVALQAIKELLARVEALEAQLAAR